jgi:hypothetical protein
VIISFIILYANINDLVFGNGIGLLESVVQGLGLRLRLGLRLGLVHIHNFATSAETVSFHTLATVSQMRSTGSSLLDSR